MSSASDSLNYIKYLEYDKYNKYKYIDYNPYSRNMKLREIENKLHGLLFDCPRCTRHSVVSVSIDSDLLTDNYFIRVICRYCGAYNSIQVSSFALQLVKDIDLVMSAAIKDTIASLRDDGTFDLDSMIDEDWKLAGSQ